MEPFGIGMAATAALASLGAFGLAFRRRRRAAAPRTLGERLEALGQAQAELGLRFESLAARAAAPEERLQAMAGQLLGLIRDKNATLETALAGLDQLRARLRALEQIGEPAEARALYAGLAERVDALQVAQAAGLAGLEARLAGPGPALAEAVLGRLGPLEARLAGLEAGHGAAPALKAAREEIAVRRALGGDYGYAFFVVAP
jgi:hypothetical protein